MNGLKRAIVGVLIAAPIAIAPLSGSATAAPPGGPIRGVVTDQVGNALADVTVEVTAFPAVRPDKGLFSEIVLGTAVTDSNGSFELNAATPTQPGVAFPSGDLDLQFQVVNDTGADFMVSALSKPPTRTGQSWKMDSGKHTGVDSARRSSLVRLVAPAKSLTTSQRSGEVNGNEPDYRPIPVDMCPNTPTAPQWAYTGDETDRSVPLQRIRTGDRATWDYAYQSSKGTSIEWAFSGARGAFAGGLTKLEAQTTASGMVIGGGGNVAKMVMGTFRFKRYQLYCASTTWPYAAVATNDYRWMPSYFTGNADKIDAPINFSCSPSNKVTTSARELWVARETGVKFLEWFSIAGVGLNNAQYNNAQTEGDAVRLTYYKRPAYTKFALCGRDNVPTLAIQVQEVAP